MVEGVGNVHGARDVYGEIRGPVERSVVMASERVNGIAGGGSLRFCRAGHAQHDDDAQQPCHPSVL